MLTRSRRKSPTLVSLALLASTALTGCGVVTDIGEGLIDQAVEKTSTQHTTEPQSTESVTATVIRVTDGDTIVVQAVPGLLEGTNTDKSEHSIRLLGIDTPEMNFNKTLQPECGAEDATDHLAALLPTGTAVLVTFDAHADQFDRYGRSLAYVSIMPESTDVNLAQIEAGYAEAWVPSGEPKPERWEQYTAADDAAQAEGIGSHATCDTIGR